MDQSTLTNIRVLARRWWLILLAMIITAAIAYVSSQQQSVSYNAEMRLFIGDVLEQANPNLGVIETGEQLALLYGELARNPDFLDPVIEELNLELEPEEMAQKVSTGFISGTPILILTVQYDDAELAEVLVRQVADEIVRNSPTTLSPAEETQRAQLSQQISDLEDQISITRQQSLNILEELNEATAERDVIIQEEPIEPDPNVDPDESLPTVTVVSGESELGTRITTLTQEYNESVDRLNSSLSILAQLTETYLSLSNRINTPQVIQEPRVTEDRGLSPFIIIGAAAVVGAILAITALLLLEYLTDRVHGFYTGEFADLPILAKIQRTRLGRNPKNYQIIAKDPTSDVAEDFRAVRTNLIFNTRDNLPKNQTYIIASTQKREGRTFVAVNLAASIAETGKRVLLIDANLRDPKLHKVFELSNERNFARLLRLVQKHPQILDQENADRFIQEAGIKRVDRHTNLYVLVNRKPPNQLPPSLIGFDGIEPLLKRIQKEAEFDIILMDTTACMEYADTYTLAAKTNATIVLVAAAEKTRRVNLLQVKKQLDTIGQPIDGIILNRV